MKAILQRRWETWKRFGRFIGDFIGRVFLTVFYFTLAMPFGLGVRHRADPLGIRPGKPAKWLERRTQDLTLKDTRRLF